MRSDRARLSAVELVPFRAAIASGVSGIMTAHIALPAIEPDSTPATLVPAIVTGLLRDSLGFRGLTITDALDMSGVGKGYSVEASAVLAVKAGADVLLKPTDVRRSIEAVIAAVERGEISRARIDSSVRRILETKIRTGTVAQPVPDIDEVRRVVGSPAHWAASRAMAAQAVTVLRDRDSLVGPTPRSLAVVTYAPDLEVLAGRAFAAEAAIAVPGMRTFRILPRSSRAELDSIAALLRGIERVIVTTHVRTVEGQGRTQIPPHIAAWVDSLAGVQPLIVVAHGNPYVIRQFPHVGTWIATFGMQEPLERAAARIVTGRARAQGHSPISLPGFFSVGDGVVQARGYPR